MRDRSRWHAEHPAAGGAGLHASGGDGHGGGCASSGVAGVPSSSGSATEAVEASAAAVWVLPGGRPASNGREKGGNICNAGSLTAVAHYRLVYCSCRYYGGWLSRSGPGYWTPTWTGLILQGVCLRASSGKGPRSRRPQRSNPR